MSINVSSVGSGATPIAKPATPAAADGGAFQNALQGVADSLTEADLMSQQAATGELTELSQLTAATAKAELAIQLTVAFRDRAVGAFEEIMRMQI